MQHSERAKINLRGTRPVLCFPRLFNLFFSTGCPLPPGASELTHRLGSQLLSWVFVGGTGAKRLSPAGSPPSSCPSSPGLGQGPLVASPRWRRRERRARTAREPPRLVVSPRWRRVSPVGRRGRGGGGVGFHSGGRWCHTGALPGWRPPVLGQQAGKCRWGGGGRRPRKEEEAEQR